MLNSISLGSPSSAFFNAGELISTFLHTAKEKLNPEINWWYVWACSPIVAGSKFSGRTSGDSSSRKNRLIALNWSFCWMKGPGWGRPVFRLVPPKGLERRSHAIIYQILEYYRHCWPHRQCRYQQNPSLNSIEPSNPEYCQRKAPLYFWVSHRRHNIRV